MFYLFILESIGTSELMLIGLIALIVFGPRKLPELARMLGKAMNEFRRSTDDFKKTWTQEVDFELNENKPPPNSQLESLTTPENSIGKETASIKNEVAEPKIRELSQADFEKGFPQKEVAKISEAGVDLTNKRDWL